jgi:adenosylcobyric acid synthase
MGQTTVTGELNPVAWLDNGEPDGYLLNSRCWGTYLHGILDNEAVVNDLLADYTSPSGVSNFNFQQFKEQQYDRLAEVIREHIDMEQVYASLHV